MGAKVLTIDAAPRGLASVNALLDQLSGDGRLILTAASATEEAWEHQQLGHGLLTYHLLEALQGAEEVRQAGKLSVFRLLDYVIQRVIDGAAQFGKPQHPTLKGNLDGRLTWPVFAAGNHYHTAFPERAHPRATADFGGISNFGFPTPLLEAWAGSIPSLNQLQLDAINEFNLLGGDHLVVSAPTSSGKTMVGELAALRGVLDRKRAFFLLPLRALVNDKHQHFQRTYGQFGLRIIRATGEITDDIPDLMRGHYDVCLMTYEKFAALALSSPHLLEQVGTIVVDEVQMVADASRGVNLEFLLTLLRSRRRQGIEPQLIALSAVIGDTNGLERWLGARLLRRTDRPVPLDEGILIASGSYRHLDASGSEQEDPHYIQRQWGKGSSQDWLIPLVRRLVAEGKQVIVFRETRGEARGCAVYLARELGLPPAQAALDRLPAGDPSLASAALREALAGGVAFHISDLDRDERPTIEEEFRAPNSTIRVIAATTTLAMGVNTPAEAVVVAGLEHPGGEPYSVAEYKNIVGRAGRLGFATAGQSFLLALSDQEEYHAWSHYICGQPENVVSRLLDRHRDPRSLVLRVLVAAQRAAGSGLAESDIVEFLEDSFGAFQQRQIMQTWRWDQAQLIRALQDLDRHRLVQRDADGSYSLTEMGRLAGESGVEVESMTRLIDALAPLDANGVTDPTLIAATQLTVELDEVHFPFNKRSTQKEPQAWNAELRRQGVGASVLAVMHRVVDDAHQATLRSKKTVACLLWITDRPIAEIEGILTQFGGRFDGAAGPMRSVASRTGDLLPTVVRTAELLHPGLDLAERQVRLLARLEFGIPGSLVDIARFAGSRLTRADYLQLLRLGSIDDIEDSDEEALIVALGGSSAKLEEVRRALARRRADLDTQATEGRLLPLYQP